MQYSIFKNDFTKTLMRKELSLKHLFDCVILISYPSIDEEELNNDWCCFSNCDDLVNLNAKDESYGVLLNGDTDPGGTATITDTSNDSADEAECLDGGIDDCFWENNCYSSCNNGGSFACAWWDFGATSRMKCQVSNGL